MVYTCLKEQRMDLINHELSLTKKRVKGAMLIPIYRYAGEDQDLNGQPCVFLGKERAGRYSGKFNFFGGLQDQGESLTDTLLRETREELMLDIQLEDLHRCILKVDVVSPPGRNDVGTLLAFVHIKGLSRAVWKSMLAQRTQMGVASKYLEMSDVSHVPLAAITNSGTSNFVRQCQTLIRESFELCNEDNALRAVEIVTYLGLDDIETLEHTEAPLTGKKRKRPHHRTIRDEHTHPRLRQRCHPDDPALDPYNIS